MATEVTFKSLFSGRLPALMGGAKVPGAGLKVKYGQFTIGTAEYPEDGYTAADLEGIVGLTRIETIVPCGPIVNGSGEAGFPVGWDSATRTLRVFSITTTGDTEKAMTELTTNSALIDAGVFNALVIGY